nr:unnamed protein product [Digitaria exilis]
MGSSPLPLASLLLLGLLLISAPSPSDSASLSFLTDSSNASITTFADPELEDPAPEPTFLEEVIDAVSEKYDWDPDAEVRVWPLDADAVRVGEVQRYEFRARAGGVVALARFSDEAVEWRRPTSPAVEEVDGRDGVDVIPGDGAFGFGTGVRDVELVGPVELKLSGNEDGGLVELQLPSGNVTYTRLKRILVTDGVGLKLERDITEEDSMWKDVPEWKTQPMVQRLTLDIVAKVEDDDRLKAISVKKARQPFPIVDTTSWGSLTSNVSFTQFMSFVLPPEPLSLDVKW